MKNDDLTIEQKLAVANIAKEIVIATLNNRISNNFVISKNDDPRWYGNSVDTLYDYLYEHITSKIKE